MTTAGTIFKTGTVAVFTAAVVALALSVAVALSLLLSSTAHAGDAALGEVKAGTCAACHGAGGNAPLAGNPKLAGQHEKYLIQAMRDYQTGARKNAVMNPLAADWSRADIADLAAYFSQQPGDLQ